MFFSKIKQAVRQSCEMVRSKLNRAAIKAITFCIISADVLFPANVFASSTRNNSTSYIAIIGQILSSFIDIIATFFIASGILLGTYSIGQLALALKNDDADSKTRASHQLVISAVLIAIKPIMAAINLIQYLS